jgi:hypothetical protein
VLDRAKVGLLSFHLPGQILCFLLDFAGWLDSPCHAEVFNKPGADARGLQITRKQKNRQKLESKRRFFLGKISRFGGSVGVLCIMCVFFAALVHRGSSL